MVCCKTHQYQYRVISSKNCNKHMGQHTTTLQQFSCNCAMAQLCNSAIVRVNNAIVQHFNSAVLQYCSIGLVQHPAWNSSATPALTRETLRPPTSAFHCATHSIVRLDLITRPIMPHLHAHCCNAMYHAVREYQQSTSRLQRSFLSCRSLCNSSVTPPLNPMTPSHTPCPQQVDGN